ncbi:MAG: tetratricopeptide repeat-containing sensor histidine kinase [Marinifilaceae bacterium]
MKYIFICTLFLILSYNCLSQDNNMIAADSLLIYKVDSLNEVGINFLTKAPTKGIKINKRALKISKNINYKRGAAISLNYISRHNYRMAQYDIAQDNLFKALNIHKEIGFKKGVMITYQSLGVIYSNMNKFDEALEYINKAIEIATELNHTFSIGISYGNMAIVYKEQEKYDEAIKNYNISLEIFKKEKKKYQTARTLYNMGNLYVKIKQYDKALKSNTKAFKLYKELNNEAGIIVSKMLYGTIYTKKKKLKLAEQYLLKAYEDSRNFEEFEKEATLYNYLYHLYNAKKDYKNALKYHVLYQDLYEKKTKEKSLQNTTFAKERYQSELKETENQNLLSQQKLNQDKIKEQKYFIIIISILFLSVIISSLLRYRQKAISNKLLNNQKEKLINLVNKLNSLIKEKDSIMSILSHDLKNPFNVILGLLDSLESDYGHLDEKEIKDYIKMSATASKSAYALLEDILTWSRTQTNGIKLNPQETNLHELCKKSIDVLQPSAKRKKIKLENITDKNTLIRLDKFTISTAINNITSNALKFTKEGGSISISSETNKKNVYIKIKDTGVGMSQSKINQLFKLENGITTVGTNNEKGTGLGLLICHEFILLNNGKIIIESQEGKGSTFTIILPLNNNRTL